MRDKGEEGSENPQNLRDVIYGWSLTGNSAEPRPFPVMVKRAHDTIMGWNRSEYACATKDLSRKGLFYQQVCLECLDPLPLSTNLCLLSFIALSQHYHHADFTQSEKYDTIGQKNLDWRGQTLVQLDYCLCYSMVKIV